MLATQEDYKLYFDDTRMQFRDQDAYIRNAKVGRDAMGDATGGVECRHQPTTPTATPCLAAHRHTPSSYWHWFPGSGSDRRASTTFLESRPRRPSWLPTQPPWVATSGTWTASTTPTFASWDLPTYVSPALPGGVWRCVVCVCACMCVFVFVCVCVCVCVVYVDSTCLFKLFQPHFLPYASPLGQFYDTEFAGSATGLSKGGLTPLGYQLLAAIEAKGMIADVSFASRQTVLDVAANASRPVVCTRCGVLDERAAAKAKDAGGPSPSPIMLDTEVRVCVHVCLCACVCVPVRVAARCIGI